MIDFGDDDVVAKWKQSGLLQGKYDAYEQKTLAWMLEDMCQHFLREVEYGNTTQQRVSMVAGYILPIIVRLFRDKELRFMNPEKLYCSFGTFLEPNMKLALSDPGKFCEKFINECDPGEFMF